MKNHKIISIYVVKGDLYISGFFFSFPFPFYIYQYNVLVAHLIFLQ